MAKAKPINTENPSTNIATLNYTRILRVAEGAVDDTDAMFNGKIEQAEKLFAKLYKPETDLSLANKIVNQILQMYRKPTSASEIFLDDYFQRVVLWQNASLQELYHLPIALGEQEPLSSFEQHAQDVGVYRQLDPKVVDKISKRAAPWDGKTWQKRFKGIPKEQKEKMLQSIRSSMAQGKGMPSAWRRLSKQADIPRQRAKMIARTEIQRISNDVSDVMFRKNKDVIEGVTFIATLEDTTCETCGGYDGNNYYFEGSPAYSTRPYIPVHPNCKCTYAPISKLWKELNVEPPLTTRASKTGPVSGKTSFEKWLKGQKKPVQLQVLGKERFALFQTGASIRSFSAKGRVIRLDQLGKVTPSPPPPAVGPVASVPTVFNPLSPPVEAIEGIGITTPTTSRKKSKPKKKTKPKKKSKPNKKSKKRK